MKFSIDLSRFFHLRSVADALNGARDVKNERLLEKRSEIASKEGFRARMIEDERTKTSSYAQNEKLLVTLYRERSDIRADMDRDVGIRGASNGLLQECRELCQRRVQRFNELDI